jgi:hypothetical protein
MLVDSLFLFPKKLGMLLGQWLLISLSRTTATCALLV